MSVINLIHVSKFGHNRYIIQSTGFLILSVSWNFKDFLKIQEEKYYKPFIE